MKLYTEEKVICAMTKCFLGHIDITDYNYELDADRYGIDVLNHGYCSTISPITPIIPNNSQKFMDDQDFDFMDGEGYEFMGNDNINALENFMDGEFFTFQDDTNFEG